MLKTLDVGIAMNRIHSKHILESLISLAVVAVVRTVLLVLNSVPAAPSLSPQLVGRAVR